jgi:adenylate cyclase
VALREAVAQLNRALLSNRRHTVRMGLNLDDIILQDDDVFGDGVNVAARLEAIAEPGTIYIAESVRDRLVGKVDFVFEDLGPKGLKNISRPIRVLQSCHSRILAATPSRTSSPTASPKT